MMRAREAALLTALVVGVALSGAAASFYYLDVARSPAPSGAVTVTIVAAHGSFTPAEFSVREGQRVTIVLVNDDSASHELVVPEFEASTGFVQAGSSGRTAFVTDRAGTFGFGEPSPFGYLSSPQPGAMGTMTVLPP